MKFQALESRARKNIALVAHDNRKPALIDWCVRHRDILVSHGLCATGTTGTRIARSTGLPVESLLSGPLGGDQQIGARISGGDVDMLVFFWDPFEPLPHDPDVKALLRIAAVWNVPVACNQASADFMIQSTLMHESYARTIPDYDEYLKSRVPCSD